MCPISVKYVWYTSERFPAKKLLQQVYLFQRYLNPSQKLNLSSLFECVCMDLENFEKLCALKLVFKIVAATLKVECNSDCAFYNVCHALDHILLLANGTFSLPWRFRNSIFKFYEWACIFIWVSFLVVRALVYVRLLYSSLVVWLAIVKVSKLYER